MKILISGSDKVYAIENFYKKYLDEFGADVKLFTAQNFFYDYYNRSIINKLKYRAGVSTILRDINDRFKKSIDEFEPDIIWIFKGMEILPASLQWAKAPGSKLVNYNPDNPFIFSGKGSGNRNITKSIPLYDLHFTYNLEVKQKLQSEYKAVTAFLPFGFDLNQKLFEDCERQEELIRLCFAGNPDEQRASFIKQLADAGIIIDVYGHYWNRFINHANVNICTPVYGDEFWKVLRRYRVQLNLMRIHNKHSHNMRTFEVPGVGGIMLAPDTVEHKLFFRDGKEAFLFSDIQGCINLAKEILSFAKTQADEIRANARARSISSGYTYRDRAREALVEMNKLDA